MPTLSRESTMLNNTAVTVNIKMSSVATAQAFSRFENSCLSDHELCCHLQHFLEFGDYLQFLGGACDRPHNIFIDVSLVE